MSGADFASDDAPPLRGPSKSDRGGRALIMLGLAMLAFMVAVTLLGPLIAPYTTLRRPRQTRSPPPAPSTGWAPTASDATSCPGK